MTEVCPLCCTTEMMPHIVVAYPQFTLYTRKILNTPLPAPAPAYEPEVNMSETAKDVRETLLKLVLDPPWENGPWQWHKLAVSDRTFGYYWNRVPVPSNPQMTNCTFRLLNLLFQ